ncbi:MAG: pilus assembly protein TadG-related protein [Acidimicrobiia bacterium]|nr:pilus assembly protein TadG-related protein [Acidimicrobiia bacterium]
MTRTSLPNADERGVTLPMVALSMVVLLGMASLVIDLGNGWRTRRALIAATDAAALAAAQDFVNDTNGCTSTAGSYLTSNESTSVLVSCVPFAYSADHGRVTVTADQNVDTWFAAVIGEGDYDAQSVTTAVWGPPAGVTGLRPIGLCVEGSAALRDVIDNPPATETLIRIDYDKDQPDACGGASVPGNWGTIDFDGGSNSNNDTKDWVANGYPGEVQFGNHPVTSCAGESHCYEGDTGALAGINAELNGLQNSGIYFTLPVFNFVENPGANAEFHLMGVVRVRLIDYQVNGNPNNRFFELLVKPGLITGTCCGGPGGAGGNKVIALCGVDPNAFGACAP